MGAELSYMILPSLSQLIGPRLSNHLKHPISLPQYFLDWIWWGKASIVSLIEEVVKWETSKQAVNSPIICHVEKAGV